MVETLRPIQKEYNRLMADKAYVQACSSRNAETVARRARENAGQGEEARWATCCRTGNRRAGRKGRHVIRGLIFDLDGVIVDTAKYHYLAWKELAETLGLRFSKKDNERLKGVSRVRSFEIILEINGLTLPRGTANRRIAHRKTTAIWSISGSCGKMKSCPAPSGFCWMPARRGFASRLAAPARIRR